MIDSSLEESPGNAWRFICFKSEDNTGTINVEINISNTESNVRTSSWTSGMASETDVS